MADVIGGAWRVFIVSDPFMVSRCKISYVTDYLDGTGAEVSGFAIITDHNKELIDQDTMSTP